MSALAEFGPWIDAGFLPDLLPIIPPDAALSPYSKLTLAHRGKTPGLPTPDGWTGFPDWPAHVTTRKEIDGWLKILDGAPYNIGLNSRRLHAIDCDTTDPAFAQAALDYFAALLPSARITGYRVGRQPGWLLPFRPTTPAKKKRAIFSINGVRSVVEFLGAGQQFVVAGMHPCGSPYSWHPWRDGGTIQDALKVLA